MTKGKVEEISLVINATGRGQPTDELDRLPGKIVTNETKVTGIMSAELGGSSFKIEPSGPQQKIVTRLEPVRWTWYVTPQVEGVDQVLALNINAHIRDAGQLSPPFSVQTFRDRIIVDVARWDKLTEVAQIVEPFFPIFGTMATGGWGVFLWVRRRRRRVRDVLLFKPQDAS